MIGSCVAQRSENELRRYVSWIWMMDFLYKERGSGRKLRNGKLVKSKWKLTWLHLKNGKR